MIKILPPSISNLIAAGEVVQKPASVVKELMENAIDASAENITVIIEDAGRTLIQIIDDGCGMTPQEARLSFERHATSKISVAEDLNSILTYGFRGEALASIAAVAEITMKTRKKGSEVGSETIFADSQFISQEASSSPEGTNIAVRNIFYNVPARRKFLKSDNAEFRHIISEFSHVALCRPEVSFKLIHNKKDIFNLRSVHHLKKRILEVEGREMIKELVEINVSTSIISLSGFIGNPEDARKTPGNQYLFVNGRYFRSSYFHKAITKAYEKLIPEGYVPSYFIFFEIDPASVDINIHPSKTEVKFEEDSAIFEILNAAVREALGMNSFVPSIDFDMEGAPDIPVAHSGKLYTPPKIDFDPLFNPFNTSHSPNTHPITFSKERTHDVGGDAVDGYDSLFEEKFSPKNNILIHSKYIFTTVKSGILVINIYRAKERIYYERFLHSLDNSTPIAIGTLFPVTMEISRHDYDILFEDSQRLKSLGFDISPFGESTIVVNGVPDGFSPDMDSVHQAIDGLVAAFMDNDSSSLQSAQGRNKMAKSLARSAAKGAILATSPIEAQLLVDSLFACAEPDRTPDGKKTMEIITIEDLDKRL